MIEISNSKLDKMSEYIEDMLWAGGQLMHCLEGLEGESYGERSERSRSMMGSRGGYGNRRYSERGRMGYREEEDWDDEDEMMGERRGRRRDSRGRYRS